MTLKSVPAAPEASLVASAPFGRVCLAAYGSFLTDIRLLPDPGEVSPPCAPEHPVLTEALRQFQRYFEDASSPFLLPLRLAGTTWQQGVWQALARIPPGRTLTYGELARTLSSGPRAIAGACRDNIYPVVIPCHRVLSAKGMGGYCGQVDGPMMEIKRWLLRHEGVNV